MNARLARALAIVLLATTPSCVLGAVGAAAGGGVGYAVASDNHKGAGAAVGALVGLALGGLFEGMVCAPMALGAYTMSRSSSGPDAPWYCH